MNRSYILIYNHEIQLTMCLCNRICEDSKKAKVRGSTGLVPRLFMQLRLLGKWVGPTLPANSDLASAVPLKCLCCRIAEALATVTQKICLSPLAKLFESDAVSAFTKQLRPLAEMIIQRLHKTKDRLPSVNAEHTILAASLREWRP